MRRLLSSILALFILAGHGAILNAQSGAGTILETSIRDGSILARVAAAETISGAWTFSALQTFTGIEQRQAYSGAGTSHQYARWTNTGGDFYFGLERSVGGAILTGAVAYSSLFGTAGATSLHLGTNGAVRLTIDSAGLVTVGSATALARLAVDGQADEIQLLIQGNATQTASLVTFENVMCGTLVIRISSKTFTSATGARRRRLRTNHPSPATPRTWSTSFAKSTRRRALSSRNRSTRTLRPKRSR